MADPVLIAVAGGAAGSVLTLLARTVKVPAEVSHHDRSIQDIDADLERFIADEHTRLVFEASELRGAAKPTLRVALDIAFAVDHAIHKYRDGHTSR
jgi:hypothetical protein